ncbi:helix-turn-helix domain-containing protein [Amycolatopsis alkalitolerans]|uniref:helix-turn-helix domain-containing protein n=1 Tax=Amycolatopsis alkalitolerans TaxID=2547244 RepID=UPI00190F35D7|nr:helix-turn-helix domain-containing protein [Amycolatopsis alkalitolerans]
MSNQELLDQVRRRRGEGKTPKEIARALGVPPSKVTRWCGPSPRSATAPARRTWRAAG